MCSSSLPARIICNDHVLANTLRGQMATIAPDCEVLSASDDCSQAPFCRWLGESLPARTTIAAAGLPRGAKVEIDAVAVGHDL